MAAHFYAHYDVVLQPHQTDTKTGLKGKNIYVNHQNKYELLGWNLDSI